MGKRTHPLIRLRGAWDVAPNGCWEWNRARDDLGYGRTWDVSLYRMTEAYRLVYRLFVGPIPDGLEIDHRCRNPSCVNPHHLEPVTHAENMRRIRGVNRMTECKWGHPMVGGNIYVSHRGKRLECRTCRNRSNIASKRRKRERERRERNLTR